MVQKTTNCVSDPVNSQSKQNWWKGCGGKERTGYWMIGGCVPNHPEQSFLEMVEKRDQDSIKDIIERHIEPGSIIHTDMWKGYSWIGKDKKKRWKHRTVNHSKNQWTDEEAGTTTNHVEALWRIIRFWLLEFGVPRWYHPHYIAEKQYKRQNVGFLDFLRAIGSVTNDMMEIMMENLAEEKKATKQMLETNAQARHIKADLFKETKKLKTFAERRLTAIAGQTQQAEKKLASAKERIAKRNSDNQVDPAPENSDQEIDEEIITKKKRTHSERDERPKRSRKDKQDPSFEFGRITKGTRDTFPLVPAPPKDTKIGVDFQKLKKRFPEFKIRNVRGDGNCWLWSVLVQLVKMDDFPNPPRNEAGYRHCMMKMRGGIADEMENNPEDYVEAASGDDENPAWLEFLTRVRSADKEGGDIELAALARKYDLNIQIEYPDEREATQYGQGSKIVRIGFCGGCHYVALF
ncbi:hypothetical protein BLNAU_23549 [Blattamonas nauphoetae]|uniref:OTU domain-containing protein n=1 Tax=Blattamonas nauphoetae TaxID=2049346 RepID=A0ABQ9WPX3_9EUKA|nr:hypothetical protein BLNAU_23549 [Blattamonas nauphoetae]